MKLGITLNNIGANQLSYYILQQLNSQIFHDIDTIIFYSILHKPCLVPNVGVMHVSEIWGYDGVLIATDLTSAARVLRSPGPTKKYFYIWDLEWRINGPHEYSQLSQIYCNPKLEIITRSESHQSLIKNCWNRDSKICDNCNIVQLEEIINGR